MRRKLTAHQEAYIRETVQAVANQFDDVVKGLEDITKLTEDNFKAFSGKLAQMIFDGTVEEDVLKLSPKLQKQHFEAIRKEIKETFEGEYKAQKKKIEDELLTKAINYDLYKGYTLNADFNLDPLENMEDYLNIVNAKVNGKDWSDRLWASKKETMEDLNKMVKKLGKGYVTLSEVSKSVRKYQDKNTYAVKRLVRNELVRVQSGINEKFDKDNGIEWQLFMATLDSRTSDICRSFDGRSFRINDPNKPIPPDGTHIQCRSCLVGIPDKNWRPATRRDNETGEIIPYKSWKEENEVKVEERKVVKPKPKPKKPANKPIREMNFEELEIKAKEFNITFDKELSPKGFDIDLLRESVLKIEEIQKELPVLKKQSINLRSRDMGNTSGMAWANGNLDLNSKSFASGSSHIEKLKEELKRNGGWLTKSDNTLIATFTHEYGHIVNSFLKKELNEEDKEEYAKKLRSETMKEYKKNTGEKIGVKDLKQKLSTYGSTNALETFAEAFQEAFNCENPREYAKAFKSVLLKELGKCL